ncbi:hypothetical protein [Streptomyces sp. PpalLS-921]|uniref:hypothetical protein n=1 Tax=Streptomyces sp. PpalLS-921 TaxID=1839772 RepID=UPI00081E6551|nr:hypothetical protein [Streptomyces sp. PpalLS-921]SCD33905.1 hypothetical protein GA0115249_101635 [Streptomyces sp. PpalLS-921]
MTTPLTERLRQLLFPLAYGLAAPAGTILIMASMGRFRTNAEDPAHEDASLPADTDGK